MQSCRRVRNPLDGGRHGLPRRHARTRRGVGADPGRVSTRPLSQDDDLALISARVACVVESYEFRVACVAPGQTIGTFGREGEGPGEFRDIRWLGRIAPDRVGVVDNDLHRLTVFQTGGEIVSETLMPSGFVPNYAGPASLFGEGLLGLVPGTMYPEGPLPRHETMSVVVLVEVSLASGEVVWHRQGLEGIAEVECEVLNVGTVRSPIPTPAGGYVLTACGRQLVFLEDRDAPSGIAVAPPNYFRELPNERDVQANLEGLARWNAVVGAGARRSGTRISPSAMAPYAAGYAERSKTWFLPRALLFDDQGRLWIATQRDRDHFSY